jgi:predicted nucleic-acid-binding Zn-ribbon protein
MNKTLTKTEEKNFNQISKINNKTELLYKIEYECEKCNGKNFEKGEIRTCSNNFMKIFNVQNNRYLSITCTDCGTFILII